MKSNQLLSVVSVILVVAAFCAPAAAGPKEDFSARSATFRRSGARHQQKILRHLSWQRHRLGGKARFPKSPGAVRTLDQASRPAW
jgi:hypothetical protein